MIKPGRYRHYKGKDYEVLGVARHSETEAEYVVYRQLYGAGGLWIRPAEHVCSNRSHSTARPLCRDSVGSRKVQRENVAACPWRCPACVDDASIQGRCSIRNRRPLCEILTPR
jgi:hypothetical protein